MATARSADLVLNGYRTPVGKFAVLGVAHAGRASPGVPAGAGYVAGVSSIEGVPARTFVRLLDSALGFPVAQGWTDKAGVYRFGGLDPTRTVDVLFYDRETGVELGYMVDGVSPAI